MNGMMLTVPMNGPTNVQRRCQRTFKRRRQQVSCIGAKIAWLGGPVDEVAAAALAAFWPGWQIYAQA
jgi:hypothetical protein